MSSVCDETGTPVPFHLASLAVLRSYSASRPGPADIRNPLRYL